MINLTEQEFHLIETFVRKNYGINLEKKSALVQARLSLDIERKGYSSFQEYYSKIVSDPTGPECQHMIDKISTNHTFFFREPASFDHMRNVVVPALIRGGVKDIKVWSAAASTGQEIYTIAMLLDDMLSLHQDVTFHITGSDINQEVLNTARDAVYPDDELKHIPSIFHARYCNRNGDGTFAISPKLKKNVSLFKKNLALPFGVMSRYHMVFCRNVMIYFKNDTKQQMTSELHRVIYPGGFLYVGCTETVDSTKRLFQYVKTSVFARLDGAEAAVSNAGR